MGIDMYMRWKGMDSSDTDAQFALEGGGSVGYLRESYHGGPYATQIIAPECWSGEQEQRIPAKTLASRAPHAVVAALIRDATIYHDQLSRDILCEVGIEPDAPRPERGGQVVTIDDDLDHHLGDFIATLFGAAREQVAVPHPSLEQAARLFDLIIERKPHAGHVLAFIALAVKKEQETGEPVTIISSY